MTRPISSMIIAAVMATVCISFFAAAQSPVAGLVAKMPGDSAADANAVSAEFIKLGAPAIVELCGLVQSPGASDDTNARYAVASLVKFVSRGNTEAERAMVAGAMLGALKAASDKEIKAFLIEQLAFISKDECVAPLSAYLGDDRLCDLASRALVTAHTPAAEAALAKALADSKGRNRLAIIQALGELRAKSVLSDLAKDAASADLDLRQAALSALANIGDPASADAIAQGVASAGSAIQKAKAVSFEILYANRLADSGSKDKCEAICRELLKSKEVNFQCAALKVLVQANGAAALDDLLAAASSENSQLRHAALELAGAIPGAEATGKSLAKMTAASPVVRAEIIAMLGRRGDKAALPALIEAIGDTDKTVRFAAMDAAVKLGPTESFAAIIRALHVAKEPDEIAAIKEVLLRIAPGGVAAVAQHVLPELAPLARIAFMEVLAARRAKSEADAVFAQTKDPDESVRGAAIEALPNLSTDNDLPRLVDLLLKAETDNEKAAAQKAVVAVAKLNADAEKRAEPILAALGKATPKKKTVLLPALPGAGGKNALAAVVALTKSADAPVKDAALRALTDWQDPAAIPELMSVLRSTEDLTLQVLALRGYIRLLEASGAAPEKKLPLYKDALDAGKRPEDKKFVLASLGTLKTIDALNLAASFLDDKDLGGDAALAASKIAVPEKENDKGLTGPEVAAILKKAAPLIANEEIRKKAEAYAVTTAIH